VYWLEQSEADVPSANDWLSAVELLHLNSLRFPKRRADWRLGRWTAKRAVAAYLNLPRHCHALAQIEIRSSPSGAPEIFLDDKPAAATISLSHRAGMVVCAIAPSSASLGCDLETIEPRGEAFVADYFTAIERALIASVPPAGRSRLVNLLWSAKESTLKALREGLRLDTRCVEVSTDGTHDSGRWHPLQVRHAEGQIFSGWWQQTANRLWTLVANPPPATPILLRIATEEGPEKTTAGQSGQGLTLDAD
jgi:4'-phosphopantetheinyl transferase